MASLGKDLSAIRDKQGLTIEELHEITRVPHHILRTIEDDSIFKDIQQNTTYIRSYVRSYAKALGVSEPVIVRALDDVENGTYDGNLGTSDGPAPEQDAPQPPRTEKLNKKEPEKKSPPPANNKKAAGKDTSAEAVSAIDWVDVGRKAKMTQSKSKVSSGLLIIVLLAAILAALFLLYHYYYGKNVVSSMPEETAAIQPENPSDSLRQSLIPQNENPALGDSSSPLQEALGDTLQIAVYAANGKLEPVRVYTDILGQQNPYWVPQGDTIRFNFVNTVRIRAVNQYDRLQLLFNGHVIQNYYQQYYNTESGMVELSRSVFENNPQWQTPADPTRP